MLYCTSPTCNLYYIFDSGWLVKVHLLFGGCMPRVMSQQHAHAQQQNLSSGSGMRRPINLVQLPQKMSLQFVHRSDSTMSVTD